MQRRSITLITLMLLILSTFRMAWAQAGPTSPVDLQSKLNLDSFRVLAVQQGGRLKPFDTFETRALCPHCGAEKEIFSDEFDKKHTCKQCKKEIDFTQCTLEGHV